MLKAKLMAHSMLGAAVDLNGGKNWVSEQAGTATLMVFMVFAVMALIKQKMAYAVTLFFMGGLAYWVIQNPETALGGVGSVIAKFFGA